MISKLRKGILISFEGVEGSGKSTIINYVTQHLLKKNFQVLKTREPGGTITSEKIRSFILKNKTSPLTEAFLFAASRHEHIKNKIKKNLQKKTIILCDRYIDSSFVYQGYVKNVGIDNVKNINKFTRNFLPDLTIILKVEPKIALSRVNKKNRFDSETKTFHQKCHEGFIKLKEWFPTRKFIYLDASEDKKKVQKKTLEIILEFFNKVFKDFSDDFK